MINEKINKIDELLNDDKILEEYINNTYDSTFNTPPGLENRILNGVYSKNIKKTNIFFDILKIAACTIIAIYLWNVTLSENISYATDDEKKFVCDSTEAQDDTEDVNVNKVKSVIDDINSYFITPFSIRGGENQ